MKKSAIPTPSGLGDVERVLRPMREHLEIFLPAEMAEHARFDTPQVYSAGQAGAYWPTESVSGTIRLDLAKSNNFTHTLVENTTLAAPTSVTPGQSGVIHLTQHASTPRTLGFNAFWKFAAGAVPTLTATNSAIDVLSYVVNPSGTSATCVLMKDVK